MGARRVSVLSGRLEPVDTQTPETLSTFPQQSWERWRAAAARPALVAILSWLVASTLFVFLDKAWLPGWPLTWRSVLPLVAIAALMAGLIAQFSVYLHVHEPDVARSPRKLYLLAFVASGYMGAQLILRSLGAPTGLDLVPAVAMLAMLFLNWRVAIGLAMALALPASLVPWQDPALPLIGLGGAWVAVHSLRRVRQRKDVVHGGFRVGLAMGLGATIAGVLLGRPLGAQGWQVLWTALSGPASAILVMGVAPYLESLTGITTPFTLLELANPSQPLLRNLLLKAPGTYHHSILVGNLGEAAAEVIGADPLLVRVGAYYHDIGKTKRPYFFIENQIGMGNQHDNINPRLSSLVITAHVKEGVELAREYRLPQQVADFIPMHHGCSLVSYFYQKALAAEGPEEVFDEHFRYPGPRPNTKETAIVMLADGIEATTRTLTRPTAEELGATIRRIVNKRLAEGELSDAPLTLGDVEAIVLAFNRVLQGLYHQRIEYPDQVAEKEEKARREERRRPRGLRLGGHGRP